MKPTATGSAGMPRSGIRKLLDLATLIPDAIHLEIGQPDFNTPAHIVDAAYHAAQAGYTSYTVNAGLASLRELIALKVARENDIQATPDCITVTVGGLGGLYTAFLALLDPGDEIMLPDPAWPNYLQMACLTRAGVVRYPLDAARGFQPDLAALPKLVTSRTKAILVNSPANPTGAVYPRETLAALVAFARAHDLYLISDECYEKIVFDTEHISPASLVEDASQNSDERIISLFSFSKAYAMTGWRVGFLVSTPELARLFAKIQEATVGCAPSVSQKAAEAALAGPQDCIPMMVASYQRRRDRALSILKAHAMPSYVPQGAFYLMVDISPCGMDSDTFAQELLRDKKVAVAPGSTFGPSTTGYVRISLATAEDKLAEGLERLCAYIKERSK